MERGELGVIGLEAGPTEEANGEASGQGGGPRMARLVGGVWWRTASGGSRWSRSPQRALMQGPPVAVAEAAHSER